MGRAGLVVGLALIASCRAKEDATKTSEAVLTLDQAQQYSRLAMPGDVHTFQFRLTNSGSRKLKVLDIKKSCGCLSVQMPVAELQPRESTVLTMKVSQDRYGLVSQWARRRPTVQDIKTGP